MNEVHSRADGPGVDPRVKPPATITGPATSVSIDTRCRNCGASVNPEDRYCPSCGAATGAQRLTFRAIFALGIEQLLSLDPPMLRTFIDLWRFPGRVAREYLDGRRKRYTNPLKYNLITAAILVGLVQLILHGQGPTLPSNLQKLPNTVAMQRVKDALALSFKWNNQYLQVVYLVSLVALAFMLWLALRRLCGRNLMEFYAMCLFGFGQIYMIQAMCLLCVLALQHTGLSAVFGVISGLSPFVYVPWMTAIFCSRGTVSSVVIGALFSLVAFVIYSILISAALFGVAYAYLWIRG